MAVEKNLKIMKNFYKKLCIPAITWNKKHLSKQVVPIIYPTKKMFLAVATFEGL